MKALTLPRRPALKLIFALCFVAGLSSFLGCSRFGHVLNKSSNNTDWERGSISITPTSEGVVIQASTDPGTLTAKVVPGTNEVVIRSISFKSRLPSEREFMLQDYFVTNLWEGVGPKLGKSTVRLSRFDLVVKLMRITSDGTQELAPKETMKINALLKGIELSTNHQATIKR
jgi:hypothetical protein